MRKIIILTLILFVFCINATATDECTYLAKVAATAIPDEPFVVKVVYCEMIVNRMEHENFPNTMPAVCYLLGVRGKLKEPEKDDMYAAALALGGTNYSCGALYFEKCDKVKRTPPEKQSGVRIYDWYFYG